MATPPSNAPPRGRRASTRREFAQPPDRVAADAERDLAHRASRCASSRPCSILAGLVLPRRHRLHRRLGLRHARRPLLAHVGQGHAVRRVPGLDARPHRGGHRARRGRRPSSPQRRRRRSRSPPSWSPCSASLMVTYTRARAEALGVECKVGIADRAVRVVILSAGLVFAEGAGSSTSTARARRLRAAGAVGHHRRSSASSTCARELARGAAL